MDARGCPMDASMFLLLCVVALGLPRRAEARLDKDAVALAGDLFRHMSVGVVTPVTCSREDSVLTMKSLRQWMVPAPLEIAVRMAESGRLGILMDYDCDSSKTTLEQGSALGLLNGSYSWLIWSEWPPSEFNLTHLELRLDSEMTWVSGKSMQLNDLPNVTHADSSQRYQRLDKEKTRNSGRSLQLNDLPNVTHADSSQRYQRLDKEKTRNSGRSLQLNDLPIVAHADSWKRDRGQDSEVTWTSNRSQLNDLHNLTHADSSERDQRLDKERTRHSGRSLRLHDLRNLANADSWERDASLDSELTRTSSRILQLYDLHKAGPDWPVNVTHAGSWHRDRGLHYMLERFKYNRRNLRGQVLRGAIVITRTPMDNLERRLVSSKNKYLDVMSKYNYAISVNLQDMYNFTLKLVPTTSWGYLNADGKTFDGVLGMLQNDQADFGISSCIVKKYRTPYFDFVGPSWVFRSCIMFRQPATLGVRGVLFMPFTIDVWLWSSVIFAVITLLLRLQHWAEHRWRLGTGNTEDSWSATVIFTVGSVSQQGTTSDSDWLSWRMVILFTSVMALMFDTYYSAAVVTSLLLPPPKTIRTKRDLIDSPLAVGVENMTYTMDYFRKTTDPLGKELYKKKVFSSRGSTPNFMTVADGVTRMRTQLFAFHAEEVSMFPLIERSFGEGEMCALSSMPLFPHAMTEHPVLKGAHFREMLTAGLRAAWERGHRRRYEQVWRPRRPPCVDSGEAVSVGLAALSPAFLLLLLGVLAASLSLLAERGVHRRRLRKAARHTA